MWVALLGRPQGECWIQALQKSENGAETGGYEQLVCGNSNVLEMKFDTVTQKKLRVYPAMVWIQQTLGTLKPRNIVFK
jgi:uncharacterized protein YfaT (DUF1175 family)